MTVDQLIDSLEEQAQDKKVFLLEDDPDDIFAQDVAALLEAAKCLRAYRDIGMTLAAQYFDVTNVQMRLIDANQLENILRSRKAQCSDVYGSIAGTISGCLRLVQAQPTILSFPNAPLTLEELQEIDGEPVYIVDLEHPDHSGWEIYSALYTDIRSNDEEIAAYGKTWLAYRRKPKV